MRRFGSATQLAAPVALLALVGLAGSFTSRSVQFQFRFALVMAAIVIALYVFIGNSGVVSFGHVSFVAVGAFAAGLTTVPEALKLSLSPDLFPIIASAEVGNAMSLVLAAAVGGLFAFLVGVALMRLSGLAAGIATFAVLVITNNVLRNWEAIGPGARTLSLVPESTSFMQATVGVIAVAILAFLYQRSRWGRVLRASSEDPYAAQGSGVNIYRQRLVAFTLSGALAGFAGGLFVHLLGSITTAAGLPRPGVPHAGHARHRRRGEPLGRGRRRPARERRQLAAALGRGRHRPRLRGRRRSHGHAPRYAGRRDGADHALPPERHHGGREVRLPGLR